MDRLQNVPCPRCGSERSICRAEGRDYLYGVPGTFYATECDACGLWFQNPRPPAHALSGLYPAGYQPHEEPSAFKVLRGLNRHYLERQLGYRDVQAEGTMLLRPLQRWIAGVRLIPCYVAEGRLMEIGCGSGSYLRGMRTLGWQNLHGVEMVEEAAAKAQEDAFDVVNDTAEAALARQPAGRFDVVVASMVLEHLLNPFAVLEAVARVIRPGGEFLFSTVVRQSLDARLYRTYWAGFDFPRHMVYFTRKDLLQALRPAFRDIEIYHQVAPADFTRSSSWCLADGRGRLVDRIVLLMGSGVLAKAAHLPLAFAGLTSRVSFRCRRRSE